MAKILRREGEKIWCPDPRNVWQLGTVVEDDGTSLHVLTLDDNEEHKFDPSQTHPFDPSHDQDLSNISDMDNLHEAPLLDLLRRRYLKDSIYTFTGDILISINPYKNIPLLYNFPQIDSLAKQEQPTPHVYVTADGAYRAMQKDGTCQSILVSGESGAGKTEASKYIMRYLANISQSGKSTSSQGGTSVEQCVLQSNPLLEAFGNAKTIRNDNSSRFGKFIKIHYNSQGSISGASTSHFLLEKSRIVGCSENERNYHIFYQLCSGLTPEERVQFKLQSASEYFYLNQGNCIQCPEVNDKKCFKELVEAMEVMGITTDIKNAIFSLVSAVLHLGNLKFTENAKNEAQCDPPDQVAELAELLQVTTKELEFALCKRTMTAGFRGSVAEISLTIAEAMKSRNGLAKAIYSEIFDWLVGQINKATTEITRRGSTATATASTTFGGSSSDKFIGILDIFGFEILQFNSFEQLCINYANEMLQQQFNQHVFVYEQDVYMEEGIDWSKLTFQDNIPCLELIEKKPLGILVLLDEQAMIGRRASDDKFITKLHQTHFNSHPNYLKPRFNSDEFIIKHYAGQVVYNVNGFLDKNNDSLHNDLIELVTNSKCSFLRSLFSKNPTAAVEDDKQQRLRRPSTNKMTGTMTVGRKFREQMNELMTQLKLTTPSFVRCVKPNNVRFPSGWNAELILNQLIYLGVMETVRIRRSGFPVRRTFLEFYEKYLLLSSLPALKTLYKINNPITQLQNNGNTNSSTANGTMNMKTLTMTISNNTGNDIKKNCEIILHAIDRENWQLGHKKVFLRDGQLRLLDNSIRQLRVYSATMIQKQFRMLFQYKEYKAIKAKIITVQSYVRMHQARQRFIRIKCQITLLNSSIRMYLARQQYKKVRQCLIRIQTQYRGYKARQYAWYLKHAPLAATKINAVVKMYLQRARYKKCRTSASLISSKMKMYLQKQKYCKVKSATIVIQKYYRRHYYKKLYQFKKEKAIRIHAIGRGFLARLKYGKQARLRAALRNKAQVAISKNVKRYLAQIQYAKSIRCIVMIQARIRANRVRTLYLQGRQATINSQAMIRGILARKKFLREKKMATKIAAFGRMVIYRARYLKSIQNIILLQSLWRMQLHRTKYRNVRGKFIKFQSLYRSYKAQRLYQHRVEKVIIIQSFVKMIPQRLRYVKTLQYIVKLSSRIRGFLVYRKYKQTYHKIIKIQSKIRMQLQQVQYKATRQHIITIQCYFRGYLAKKRAQRQRKGLLRVSVTIKSYLSKIRLRKRIANMFHAANTYDLTTILRISQEMSGILRVRNKSNHMRSLAHIAAINGDLNLARFILQEFPSMEDQVLCKDSFGNTPLHYASRLAHLDMVRLLCKIANRIQSITQLGSHSFTNTASSNGTSSANGSSSNGVDAHNDIFANQSSSHPLTDMMKSPVMHQGSTNSLLSESLRSPVMNGANTGVKKTVRRSLISTGSAALNTPSNHSMLNGNSAMQRKHSNAANPFLKPVQILIQGELRTASRNKWASKRYVIADEVCISIYKSSKDKIPIEMVELCDAQTRRVNNIENCFEIISPRLMTKSDPNGSIQFVAEQESKVQEWMQAIRSVPSVRILTNTLPLQNMICIDYMIRKEYLNMVNLKYESPLHLAILNQEDEGFEAVKTAVWLIENGADINKNDQHGNTPLHYAVIEHRSDLIETLLKKHANKNIANDNKQTPLELAIATDADITIQELLKTYMIVTTAKTADGRMKLHENCSSKLKNSTYVSVFMGAVAIAAGSVVAAPYFKVYAMDTRKNIVDTVQCTPDALIQDGLLMWFGNTWHMQTPLEHIVDGCVAVFELYRYDYQLGKHDVFCWTFFRLDIGKITSGPLTFEMYSPPVDPNSQYLARIPGDSFFQAELSISL